MEPLNFRIIVPEAGDENPRPRRFVVTPSRYPFKALMGPGRAQGYQLTIERKLTAEGETWEPEEYLTISHSDFWRLVRALEGFEPRIEKEKNSETD